MFGAGSRPDHFSLSDVAITQQTLQQLSIDVQNAAFPNSANAQSLWINADKLHPEMSI